MKVIRFRVKNYKSIQDSGDCYLENDVTIFAGKNESGKSSLLQALADFNTEAQINEKVCPIHDDQLTPTIEIEFSLLEDEAADIINTSSVQNLLLKSFPRKIQITKDIEDKYYIDNSFFAAIGIPEDINYNKEYNKAYNLVFTKDFIATSAKLGVPVPDLSKMNYRTITETLNTFQSTALASIASYTAADQEIVQTRLAELIKIATEASQAGPQPRARLTASILKKIPNFILFSSFDDIFPNEIPLTELGSNKWIKDLSMITDLDVEIITGDNSRAKITHNSKLNMHLNEDFRQFWSQDLSRLEIEWDTLNLRFWIKENGEFYEPEIRSQGRRWHLAFYIRISARSREEINNIILIDEPGLYLHASAQKDILKKLEAAGESSQIVFSTHSPYLIEHDNLGRLRLILKDEIKGTVVENKIHKVSDKETLTPILSAIGMGLNQGIANADKTNNIIVEGMSDYYYLTAFKLLTNTDNINFIFGGGSGNMPKIGMILQGWGCNVIYLYDNDQAYLDAQKNIKQEWTILTKEHLLALPVDGAIEDIFTPSDFANHVLKIQPDELTVKNSTSVKGKDKVLKAKHFCHQIASVSGCTLEEDTMKLINSLFSSLKKRFDSFPL